MLWQVLVQFVFRLAFGLAAAMTITSPRWVTSGFFRVHLWVGLGLNTLIGAVLLTLPSEVSFRTLMLVLTTAAGILSYAGAVVWLYEKKGLGRIVLAAVTVLNLLGALTVSSVASERIPVWASILDTLTSGLLLGVTVSAMLLGHWYLNTPSMKLAPLQRLIQLMVVAAVLRALVSGGGLIGYWLTSAQPSEVFWWFVALRWAAGLIGIAILAWMSSETLKIPNTQSATGILYVAVIFVFLGELTSQLLSVRTPFPL